MIVKIVRKLAEGKDGEWIELSKVPNHVLLETNDKDGNPSGKPALKIGAHTFYFGQPHDDVTKYRVLAVGVVVVCIQE